MRAVAAGSAWLLAVGCADGKVRADAVDFGRVRSATWFERKLTTELGDEHTHDFVLATVPGWCRKSQDVYAELSGAWLDVLDAILANPTDPVAQCEAQAAFYGRAADLAEPLFKDGLSAVHMALIDPNETVDVPPFDGPYPVAGFDQVDRYIVASVHQYTANPYRLYADLADCEEKAGFWESDAYAALFDVYDTWTLVEGSAEVEKRSEDAYHVELVGELVDLDSAPAGAIETAATYDHCDLSWNADFPEMW